MVLDYGFLPSREFVVEHGFRAAETARRCIRFLHWYVNEVGDYSIRHGGIRVKISPELKSQGSASWVDKTIELNKRYFLSGGAREVVTTMAHEIAHHEQYTTNRLTWSYESNMKVWEGQEIDGDSMLHADRPWEIDAYRRAKELVKLFHDFEKSPNSP